MALAWIKIKYYFTKFNTQEVRGHTNTHNITVLEINIKIC